VYYQAEDTHRPAAADGQLAVLSVGRQRPIPESGMLVAEW